MPASWAMSRMLTLWKGFTANTRSAASTISSRRARIASLLRSANVVFSSMGFLSSRS
jgi:hypothetical protein